MADDWTPEITTLRQAAPHIAHDLALFRQAWDACPNRLAITSWFLLCRSLLIFFGRECRAKDRDGERDICAWHYFKQQKAWKRKLDNLKEKGQVPSSDTYTKYRHAAAKLTAHLTYDRIEYEERSLEPSPEITAYIFSLESSFLEALPIQRRSWFTSDQ